jgi:hypothetical protein
VSQEVGGDCETVSVELAATTVGADDDRVVKDVLGTCSVPNENDGQNGAAGCAHSAVVAGAAEASDAGQTTTMGTEDNLVVTDGLGTSLNPLPRQWCRFLYSPYPKFRQHLHPRYGLQLQRSRHILPTSRTCTSSFV